MDYDKLIEHLRECGTYGFKQEECRDAALAIETLRAELARVTAERDAAITDMTALMAGQCCDLCAAEYCNDRGKTEMCTAFKWRSSKED